MAVNIWGIDPKTNKPALYYLRCPVEEAKKEMLKAKLQGWKDLQIGKIEKREETDD